MTNTYYVKMFSRYHNQSCLRTETFMYLFTPKKWLQSDNLKSFWNSEWFKFWNLSFWLPVLYRTCILFSKAQWPPIYENYWNMDNERRFSRFNLGILPAIKTNVLFPLVLFCQLNPIGHCDKLLLLRSLFTSQSMSAK